MRKEVRTLEEKYAHIKDHVERVAFKNATFLFGKCTPRDHECQLHAACMEREQ